MLIYLNFFWHNWFNLFLPTFLKRGFLWCMQTSLTLYICSKEADKGSEHSGNLKEKTVTVWEVSHHRSNVAQPFVGSSLPSANPGEAVLQHLLPLGVWIPTQHLHNIYSFINHFTHPIHWVLAMFQALCLLLENKEGKEKMPLELCSDSDTKERDILYSWWHRCAWTTKHRGAMAKSVVGGQEMFERTPLWSWNVF